MKRTSMDAIDLLVSRHRTLKQLLGKVIVEPRKTIVNETAAAAPLD